MAALSYNGTEDVEVIRRQILVNAPYAFPARSNFEIIIRTDDNSGEDGLSAMLVSGSPTSMVTLAQGMPGASLREAMSFLLRLTARILSGLWGWESETPEHFCEYGIWAERGTLWHA